MLIKIIKKNIYKNIIKIINISQHWIVILIIFYMTNMVLNDTMSLRK